MRCPVCDCATTVLSTDELDNGGRKRRRECLDCGHRFNTIENVIGERGDDDARKTIPDQLAVQRCPQRKKAKPYGMSDLRIALRVR